MPEVTVIGKIEELKLDKRYLDEVMRVLAGEESSKHLRLYVRVAVSKFGSPSTMTLKIQNTELHLRFGRLSYEALEAFASSLILAIEQWNPQGRKEIEVEFTWSPGKRKRLMVKHWQVMDLGISCHTLELSLV